MIPDPVLLIEIMSPGNEAETRANIWSYATILTLQDILIVHGTRIEAELLRRDPVGNWSDAPIVLRAADKLELASIGFVTVLAALYRTSGLAV